MGCEMMHALSLQKGGKPAIWHERMCAYSRNFKFLYTQHRNTVKGNICNAFLISLIQDFYSPSTQENQAKARLGWVRILNKKLWYNGTFNSCYVERQSDDPLPIPKEKQWSNFFEEQQAVGSKRKEAYSSFPQKNLNTVLTCWRKAKFIIVSCSPN